MPWRATTLTIAFSRLARLSAVRARLVSLKRILAVVAGANLTFEPPMREVWATALFASPAGIRLARATVVIVQAGGPAGQVTRGRGSTTEPLNATSTLPGSLGPSTGLEGGDGEVGVGGAGGGLAGASGDGGVEAGDEVGGAPAAVPTKTLPDPSTATQKLSEAHETPRMGVVPSTVVMVHEVVPPVGLVDVSTAPCVLPATHSDADGHDIARMPKLSRSVVIHGPAAGVVDVQTLP